MALHFVVQVGDQKVGAVVARRREYLDLSDRDAIADTVSTYDVDVHELASNHTRTAVVEHRYGDGGLQLARAALNAALGEGVRS